MRQIIFLIGTILLLLLTTACSYAGIGLRFETAFTAPGLEGEIERVAFCDTDGDGTAEAAIAAGKRIIIYNIKSAMVVKTISFKADTLLGLVFDDVNRDRKADIVYAVTTGGNRPRFVVVGIDGASGRIDSVQFVSRPKLAGDCGDGGGTIAVFDLNRDSYGELLVSADTSWSDGGVQSAFAQTRLYHSFPDSIAWNRLTPEIVSAAYLPLGLTSPGLWTETRSCYGSNAAQIQFEDARGYKYLLPDGKLIELNLLLPTPCGSLPVHYIANTPQLLTYRATGTFGPATEVLSMTTRRYTCGDSPDTATLRTMDMLLLHNSTVMELSWSSEAYGEYRDFVMPPDLEKHFLGFEATSGALLMWRISDGTIRTKLDAVPPGRTWWGYPYADKVPRLIAVSGHEVAIYRVATVGEDVEDGRNDVLPVTFSLGQPRLASDRFGLTVPVEVPRAGRISVEIFNSRGKRIKILTDQSATQGRVELTWDASGAGSGIYYIKASQGAARDSVRALLWR